MPQSETPTDRHRLAFRQALAGVPRGGRVAVLCHNDADGLSAGAVLARGLEAHGFEAVPRLVGRGGSAWDEAVADGIGRIDPALVVVTDLGVRAEPVAPGRPTILIDHHVPQGMPREAVVVSGYGEEPTPSSSLLAYRCLEALGDMRRLLWIAALGMIGDYGEKASFPELAQAREGATAKTLREATSLINAPRRSASGDAAPALDLLMRAGSPEEIVSGEHPETALLQAARDEVKRELDAARRLPPRFAGPVALIVMHSPCQIHPLVAQSWTGRLRKQIVIAANTGFREGYVHFAARTAGGQNLVRFLREQAPPGADPKAYGQGHEGASGGALPLADWELFLQGLGFPPEGRASRAGGRTSAGERQGKSA